MAATTIAPIPANISERLPVLAPADVRSAAGARAVVTAAGSAATGGAGAATGAAPGAARAAGGGAGAAGRGPTRAGPGRTPGIKSTFSRHARLRFRRRVRVRAHLP